MQERIDVIDKKMRERRIEHDKYSLMLDENNPFQKDEPVKIISKTDFEKLGEMIKSIKTERNSFKEQVRNLETFSILLWLQFPKTC